MALVSLSFDDAELEMVKSHRKLSSPSPLSPVHVTLNGSVSDYRPNIPRHSVWSQLTILWLFDNLFLFEVAAYSFNFQIFFFIVGTVQECE